MIPGYRWAALVMVLLFGTAGMASYYGWGLTSDAEALARGVRSGSLHRRSFFGGGPGFGK